MRPAARADRAPRPARAGAPLRWPRAGRCLLALLLAFGLAACSALHYPVNPPLATPDPGSRPDGGYALRHLHGDDNSDGLLLVAAFSGGGYRAAAMAWAVLEVFGETRIHWDGRSRTLLQELDAVSAVSGGSLAAAWFARDPTHFVDSFRPRVLAVDLQRAWVSRVVSPAGLWRQTSPTYGRGDLLQEVLDEQIFHGLTYADLPRRRPMVSINATNLRFGERFEFSQDQFDHLCADLNPVPLARAVAASMAVPLLMSPVTLWNHRERCPPSLRLATAPVLGRAASSRYLHLVDGGLSDNTGIHAVLENVTVHGGLARAGRANGFRDVRRRVFVVVNAQVNADQPEDESPATPGLLRQLRSVIDVPIDRHSATSLQRLDDAVRQWQGEADAGVPATSVAQAHSFSVIEVNMARARDTAGGEAVKQIPTGLAIRPDQIEAIRRFVRRELELSPAWQALQRALQAPPMPVEAAP